MELNLSLSTEEAAVLHRILASYVSDLRTEVADTDDYDLRRRLQAEETLVKKLIVQLAADQSAVDRWADEAGVAS